MDEGDGENVEPQDEQQMEVEENRREEEFAAERFLLEDTEELDFQSFLTMVASKKGQEWFAEGLSLPSFVDTVTGIMQSVQSEQVSAATQELQVCKKHEFFHLCFCYNDK
jgi:hypothetical protein